MVYFWLVIRGKYFPFQHDRLNARGSSNVSGFNCRAKAASIIAQPAGIVYPAEK